MLQSSTENHSRCYLKEKCILPYPTRNGDNWKDGWKGIFNYVYNMHKYNLNIAF